MITFDWLLLVNWLVAVLLPLAVGLVTTRVTSSAAKALLLALFNALIAIGTEVARALSDGTIADFNVMQAVFQLLTALAIAWGAYGQFWKPTGVAAKAQASGVQPRQD